MRQGIIPAGRGDAAMNAHLAAGKAVSILGKREKIGYCGLEKLSVYGAAVAIPQIARSVPWSATLIGLSCRSYIFLLVNIFLQVFLLIVIGEQAHVMNTFAGQMHLCDFGANIVTCPNGPNCRGPGGTTYTLGRLYDYDTWSTRVFFRDALVNLFPDKAEDITAAADPGEYGLQDYYSRLVCCLLFMMAVVDEFKGSIGLAYLLWHLPSSPDSWIMYEIPEWAESKDQIKRIYGWSELNFVKFRIAGMPRRWKVLNFIVVLLPKFILWCTLVASGIDFLMETADIIDQVVNCMALTFILKMDELVFDRLATGITKHIMSNLEDLPLFDASPEEVETEAEVLERFWRSEFQGRCFKSLPMFIPKRLIHVLLLTSVFVTKYYLVACMKGPDGSWISNPLFMPTGVSYSPLTFLYGLFERFQRLPVWEMPSAFRP